MQLFHTLGDDDALYILPRALADALARVDPGIAARLRCAEIGMPVGLG